MCFVVGLKLLGLFDPAAFPCRVIYYYKNSTRQRQYIQSNLNSSITVKHVKDVVYGGLAFSDKKITRFFM